ncbi:MAG: NUDIX hydrolase [Bradyrhizobium sp.]|nr:NUDIX hydrolase [Bradyrhizobium sp.]
MSKPRIVGVRTVFERWSKLIIANIVAPSGNSFEREIEIHGSAVAVLPYDPDRRVAIVISQFRAPVDYLFPGSNHIFEAVAGIKDEDDAQDCAKREALEEAGVRLQVLEPIAHCWPMPGISTETVECFLARYSIDDRVASGGGIATENEEIEVHEWPLSDLAAYITSGAIVDLKLLMLVQVLQTRRPELFCTKEQTLSKRVEG